MKQLFSVFIICFLCYCCSDKEKKDNSILSEKQVSEIMWDLMLADQYVQDFVIKDSSKNKKDESVKLYEEIFLLHHTTHEQFEKSRKYYESDPVHFRPIIDSLAKKQNPVKPNMPAIRPDTGFQHIPGKLKPIE